MSDNVNHPEHYTKHPSGVECIQIVKFENFLIGSAIKYIMRHRIKGAPIEDLKKAIWYLQRQVEQYEEKEFSRETFWDANRSCIRG